jgi:hypothetical protein
MPPLHPVPSVVWCFHHEQFLANLHWDAGGVHMLSGRNVPFGLALAAGVLSALPWATVQAAPSQRTYVGSESCRECHSTEYESFTRNAKKANSLAKVLAKRLSESELRGCFGCHTTGYGEPGGFRSEQETPHLASAGCEVCHGPGSAHVASPEPGSIKGHLTLEDCARCHNEARVVAFRFRPMIYGGAH